MFSMGQVSRTDQHDARASGCSKRVTASFGIPSGRIGVQKTDSPRSRVEHAIQAGGFAAIRRGARSAQRTPGFGDVFRNRTLEGCQQGIATNVAGIPAGMQNLFATITGGALRDPRLMALKPSA